MNTTIRRIVILTLLLNLLACHGIGHNTAFLLQYKKELREYYAVEEHQSKGSGRGRAGETDFELIEDRENYLARIYTSNLPFSLTDEYDLRTAREPIRAGSPLNIIINKVHLTDNGETLSWIDTGEIATVVTVYDGKTDEPRHVLVSYETNISTNIDLPIRNLLAYSTESYGDEPIKIEVTLFDLDQKENEVTTEILTNAAGVGAMLTPAFAPALSVATEVGKHLINASKESIIMKFGFQLYPWKAGSPGRVSANIGVPRVFAKGRFVVINHTKPISFKDTDYIHADWDLSIFKTPDGIDLSKVSVLADDGTLRCWPIPLSEDVARKQLTPLEQNYLILTLDNTPLSSAGKIISQSDAANRVLDSYLKTGRLTNGSKKPITADLDDLKSQINRIAGENSFYLQRWDPTALKMLFELHEDPALNATDKALVLNLVRRLLPEVDPEFSKKGGLDQPTTRLKSWYETIRLDLYYDIVSGKYEFLDGRYYDAVSGKYKVLGSPSSNEKKKACVSKPGK